MGRRQARETVLRTLYQVEVGGVESERAINNTASINETLEEEAEKLGPLNQEDLSFARELVYGTIGHQNEIDGIIAALSRDWNIERLARVDHNIMRLAVYEILHRDDIPSSVTINEAVDLAKLYGSDESGKFVNGVLGKLIKNSTSAGVTPESEFIREASLMKEDL